MARRATEVVASARDLAKKSAAEVKVRAAPAMKTVASAVERAVGSGRGARRDARQATYVSGNCAQWTSSGAGRRP